MCVCVCVCVCVRARARGSNVQAILFLPFNVLSFVNEILRNRNHRYYYYYEGLDNHGSQVKSGRKAAELS